MKSIIARAAYGCVAVSLILTPIAAAAKSANDLRDLVGARAGQAEGDLESRGWVNISSHQNYGSIESYWWNRDRKNCVRVTTNNGRYQAINDVGNSDCNQKGGSDGTAAAAVGIAAVIGAIALASKSHHGNDKYNSNQQDSGDFERGHRDALYNHSYSNDRNSNAYSDGYKSGVNERNQQSSYRPEYSQYSYNNQQQGQYGGGSSVDVSDLVGAKAAGVESDLQSRGFRSVDGFESGNNGKGTVWWNRSSRQCLQMITVDGRADSITDIQTHPRCR
jgi:hypothetical protein